MNTNTINENQIQLEIDQLKIQFPQTRDLYREACVLLFFRHGITPTANKLYQLVRRGSMSAPSEALNKFWLELREKSRIRIESPDIPEELKESVGTFISTIWGQAQEAAVANFAVQIAEANDKVTQCQLETVTAIKAQTDLENKLQATNANLKISELRITEIEKIHAVDTSTLAAQEKALKTLLNERDHLAQTLGDTRSNFSQDLEKLNASMRKAEDQYRALEKKALLELDRARQDAIKFEKANSVQRAATKSEQERYRNENTALQGLVSELREKNGILTGRLSELTLQLKVIQRRIKRPLKTTDTTTRTGTRSRKTKNA